MNFEADGINKNHWADIFKFGTARLNLLVNFLAFEGTICKQIICKFGTARLNLLVNFLAFEEGLFVNKLFARAANQVKKLFAI